MSIVKIFKIIGKNIIVFLPGAVIGVAVVIRFILPWALKKALAGKEPGAVFAGAIILPPVFLILYGVLGIIIGGFGTVIIYKIVRFVLAKRKNKMMGSGRTE